jgi:hypothetical protein
MSLLGSASTKTAAGDDLRDPDSVSLRHIFGFPVGKGFKTLCLGKNVKSPDWL